MTAQKALDYRVCKYKEYDSTENALLTVSADIRKVTAQKALDYRVCRYKEYDRTERSLLNVSEDIRNMTAQKVLCLPCLQT